MALMYLLCTKEQLIPAPVKPYASPQQMPAVSIVMRARPLARGVSGCLLDTLISIFVVHNAMG